MRNPKAEMITLAQMAALAGVSKPAVTNFIHRQEASGLSLTTIAGRRTKMVDRNHPVIAGYIQNETRQPGNRAGGAPLSEAALEKLAAITEKTELAAAVLRGKYISRDLVLGYLNELQKVQKIELDAMVTRILKRLNKEFGPLSAEQLSKAREVLERPCRDAVELCSREVEKFRNDTKPRTGNPEPALSPKGKNGKKSNSLPRKR
jgi:hypothetical protein